jgi:hypothetical protein
MYNTGISILGWGFDFKRHEPGVWCLEFRWQWRDWTKNRCFYFGTPAPATVPEPAPEPVYQSVTQLPMSQIEHYGQVFQIGQQAEPVYYSAQSLPHQFTYALGQAFGGLLDPAIVSSNLLNGAQIAQSAASLQSAAAYMEEQRRLRELYDLRIQKAKAEAAEKAAAEQAFQEALRIERQMMDFYDAELESRAA